MSPRRLALALALTVGTGCAGDGNVETQVSPVINGKLTTEAPWNVRLGFSWDKTCSGSVLTEHWILTAAHCVEGHEALGDVSVYWADVEGGAESLYQGRARFRAHPDHQAHRTPNDIALIKLEDNAIDLGKTGRAKLWGASRPWASAATADRIYFTMGWGRAGDDCDENTPYLKRVSTPNLLDRADWNDVVVSTPTGWRSQCGGDSGSPWLFRRDDTLIAFAVTGRHIPWPFEWDEAALIWPFVEPWISVVSLRDGLQVTCRDAGFAGSDTFQECTEQPVTHPPDPGHGGTVCPIGKKCCDSNPDGPKCLLCVDKNRECD